MNSAQNTGFAQIATVEVVRRAPSARSPRKVGERYTFGPVCANIGQTFKDHGLTLRVVSLSLV